MTTQAQRAPDAISPDDDRVDVLMLAAFRLINTLEGWHAELLAKDPALKAVVEDARLAANALVR